MQLIETICVCGAGTMGSGIAQTAAQAGLQVILFDVNDDMLEKSKTAIANNLQKVVDKEIIKAAEKNQMLQQIQFTDVIKNCVADVIIEAVVENKEIKQQLFDGLALINNEKTIFATNTSSLSVAELSKDKSYATQFAGMHFFNPAPLMKLVEIVSTKKTSAQTIDALTALAKKLNKTPVICNDAPGFIVNHVARPYYLEALWLLEKNIADIETIDAVMEATGFKMGPFKLMDLIGIDINYAVSEIVWKALNKPERLTPSVIQKNKIEANELGRKTGKGFYKY